MREIWRMIAKTGGARAYSLIAGVLVLALTARYLGPEGRGILAVLTTWATGLATLFHLSLGQVVLHKAGSSKNIRWLDQTLVALVIWCVFASVLAWSTAALLYYGTSGKIFNGISPWLISLSLLIVPIIVWEQYSSPLLMALNRLDVANKYLILGRTMTLISISMAFILTSPLVAYVIVSNILGQIVVAFGGLRHMRRSFLVYEWKQNLIELLRGGVKLHFNAIGTFLFASLDILIVNHYAGPSETGLYQLGVQLLAMIMVIPQAASSVMYAKVAELGPNQAWAVQRRIVIQTMLIVVVVLLIVALFAEHIVIIVAGPDFLPTADIFRWQLFSVLGMSLAAVMAPQWIGRGLFRSASALTLLFGLANVSLSLLLVPKYGMLGAAWAGASTFIVSIFTNGVFFWWCGRQSGMSSNYM